MQAVCIGEATGSDSSVAKSRFESSGSRANHSLAAHFSVGTLSPTRTYAGIMVFGDVSLNFTTRTVLLFQLGFHRPTRTEHTRLQRGVWRAFGWILHGLDGGNPCCMYIER
jgi:hypothetical protein